MRLGWILLNAAVVSAAASAALAAEDPARKQLEAVILCRNIADATARLECFDKAVPETIAVLETPPPMTEQQIAEKREEGVSLFGLRLWGGEEAPAAAPNALTAAEFGKEQVAPERRVAAAPDDRGAVTEIVFGVVDYATTPDGRMILVLENGQVWRTTEPVNFAMPKDEAERRVRIREGSFGSYLLSLEGRNRSYRARRVQ